jgi:hypothetical protein
MLHDMRVPALICIQSSRARRETSRQGQRSSSSLDPPTFQKSQPTPVGEIQCAIPDPVIARPPDPSPMASASLPLS